MSGHRVHGVELAAGVCSLEDGHVVRVRRDCVRETGDGRVARTGGVYRGDRRGLGTERAAVMEAHRAGRSHGYDDPGNIGETHVGSERLAQLIHVVGGIARAQKAVDLGEVGFDELGLGVRCQRRVERGTRSIEQHFSARGLGDTHELGVVAGIDAARQRARDGHHVGLAGELGELGGKGRKLLGSDGGTALQKFGLVALVQDVQADARLALDGHEVVLDAIGIHELGHVGTHVATEQARCQHVVAELQQHAAHVEALATSGLLGGHAVHVVDDELVELIARIDGRVHGYGEDHGLSFFFSVPLWHRVRPFSSGLGPRQLQD